VAIELFSRAEGFSSLVVPIFDTPRVLWWFAPVTAHTSCGSTSAA